MPTRVLYFLQDTSELMLINQERKKRLRVIHFDRNQKITTGKQKRNICLMSLLLPFKPNYITVVHNQLGLRTTATFAEICVAHNDICSPKFSTASPARSLCYRCHVSAVDTGNHILAFFSFGAKLLRALETR